MDAVVEGVRRGHLDSAVALAVVRHGADVVADVGRWETEPKRATLDENPHFSRFAFIQQFLDTQRVLHFKN